jgi:hypothetical protein
MYQKSMQTSLWQPYVCSSGPRPRAHPSYQIVGQERLGSRGRPLDETERVSTIHIGRGYFLTSLQVPTAWLNASSAFNAALSVAFAY